MKKFLSKPLIALGALLLAFGFASCDTGGGGPGSIFIPGYYTARAYGYNFTIDAEGFQVPAYYYVTIRVDHFRITDITHTSTMAHHIGGFASAMGAEAVEVMARRVLNHQTTVVDRVAGNTVSSQGFLDGIEDAVRQAEIHENSARRFFQATQQSRRVDPVNVDILVVGSGLAGSSAALAAAQLAPNANIMLVEVQEVPGGVSAHAAGVYTFPRDADDRQGWIDYLMGRSHQQAELNMVTRWANQSLNAANFFSGGSIPAASMYSGTMDVQRMRTFAGFPCATITPHNANSHFRRAEAAGVMVWLGVEATRLIPDRYGAIIGAEVYCADTRHTWTFNTSAGVILATGGFDGNPALMARNARDTIGDPNHGLLTGNDMGSGIRMGEAVGVATVFTGGTKGFSVIGSSGILPGLVGQLFMDNEWRLVSQNGLTFANTMGVVNNDGVFNTGWLEESFTMPNRDYEAGGTNFAGQPVSDAFVRTVTHARNRGEYPITHRWMVDTRWRAQAGDTFDSSFSFWILHRAGDSLPGGVPFDDARALGNAFEAASIDALAPLIGMTPDALQTAWTRSTVDIDIRATLPDPNAPSFPEPGWNATIPNPDHGEALATARGLPRAIRVVPGTLATMGGLRIDEDARVQRAAGSGFTYIPGLWAVGDVANGQFYYLEYPGSGHALSLGMTFGYLAARNAVARFNALN